MKKAYIILTTVLLLISPILYRPFKISASVGLDAPFLGANVNIYDQELVQRFTISGTASDNTSNKNTWMCVTWNNGACKTYQNVTSDGATYTNQSTITFNNTSVTGAISGYKYLYEIEFILDNHYIGEFSARVYNSSEYQNINLFVNGTSASVLIKDFTNITNVTITDVDLALKEDNINWVFPIESYPSIQHLYNQGFTQVGINDSNNMLYPIFETETGLNVANNTAQKNGQIIAIIWADKNIYGNFDTHFQYNSAYTVTANDPIQSNTSGYLRKITFTNTSNASAQLQLQCKINGNKFSLFYVTPYRDSYAVSTDFALQFGLTNDLLNNLNIIANGNSQSQSSTNQASQTNTQASQVFQQEEQLINNQETAMQQNLDNLNIQNQNNNLFGNSKFVASAQWVKLQFDNLTNNNAYGYLITFSLVIGLALVIIGKLRG